MTLTLIIRFKCHNSWLGLLKDPFGTPNNICVILMQVRKDKKSLYLILQTKSKSINIDINKLINQVDLIKSK